jgi:hypothetical protein
MIDLPAAALKIALDCGLPDTLARLAAGIILRENPKLDAHAVNHNVNKTTDFGFTQVNSGNFGWLSLAMHRPINAQTIMDTCTNLEAGLRIEFVRYNGNPPPTVAADYSTRAMDSARAVDAVAALPRVLGRPTAPLPTLPPPCAPSWDAWALAACSNKPRAIAHQPLVALQEPSRAN